jgi:hypothetical protein
MEGRVVTAAPIAVLAALALLVPSPAFAVCILESLACIARAVYWEARDQPFDGQLGVAFVVLNRMHEGGRTACAVVNERGSFAGVTRHPNEAPRETRAWILAQEIALLAWQDPDADPTGDATYFHGVDAHPDWAGSVTPTRRIGAHLFFRTAPRRELAAAGKDARARAENILRSAGAAPIGKLVTADMGIININPANSTETSEEGNNDTSSLDKDIITIVHAEFELD